jgi:hypothetical protein
MRMDTMDLTKLLAMIAIIALAAVQYTLMYNAIRDLVRRPRVRGGNKVLWGLTILCIPIGGALIYGWMGPTSFLARPRTSREPTRRTTSPPPAPNVTPIGNAPSIRSSKPASTAPTPNRIRRTGS